MQTIKSCKGSQGFTLIELIIAVVIVGILAAISLPIYKGYVRKTMASEGIALIGAVAAAERIYYTERNSYVSTAAYIGSNTDIVVDASLNCYFKVFSIAANQTSFTATTTAVLDGVSCTVSMSGNATTENSRPRVSF